MNEIWLIERIQVYIRENFQKEWFDVKAVCQEFCYTKRHIDRLFKKYFKKTLQQYIHLVNLSQSARDIIESDNSILAIAIQSKYLTHEGFTRSFKQLFQVTPSEYRAIQLPIPLFVEYPLSHYYLMSQYKEDNMMNENVAICTVTPMVKPKRKLIYLESREAKDYFSYCEEMGCEWEGLLNSLTEKLDDAALIELPNSLKQAGYSKIASGIEVSLEFNKPLPVQYKIAILEEGTMLYFQSETYEKEEDFYCAINRTYQAINQYNPKVFGYQFDYGNCPVFNYGASTSTGARIAVPVKVN